MIILVLTHHIEGGTGTYLYEFLKLKKKIKKLNIKIALLKQNSFVIIHKDFKKYRSEYISNEINRHNFISGIFAIVLFPVKLFSLYTLVKKTRPSIVLSIDFHCGILAACLKYIFLEKISIIVTIHNNINAVLSKKTLLFRYLFQYAGSILFRKVDKLIGISYGISKSFCQFFSLKKNAETIYYGINIKKSISLSRQTIPLKERLLFSGNELKIISIGRLEDQKDFSTLIKAFNLCFQKEKNIKLFILGNGKNRKKIEELIWNLHLEKKIYVLGWKDNVFPYLRFSDIFINSSLYEGFAYTILEAMTQKLPIISTNCPYGPREILDNGKYGILTPINNVPLLSKQLLIFLKEKKIRNKYRMLAKNRAHYFTANKMLDSYKKIVRNMVTDKKNG